MINKIFTPSLIFALTCLASYNAANADTMLLRPPVTALRTYLPVKREFAHIRFENFQSNPQQILLNAVANNSIDPQLAKNKYLQAVISSAIKKDLASLKRNWQSFVSSQKAGSIPSDINEIIGYVIKKSYLDPSTELSFFAQRVLFYNDQKQQIRENLSDLRTSIRQCQESGCSHQTMTKMNDFLTQLEGQMSSIGEDAQLAMIDLQSAMQNSNQVMQLISNVAKSMHDTAKAIIQNMRA